MGDFEIEVPSDEPVIEFRRHVAAHPDLVFRLFTEPEHLRRWWGPRRLELVVCEVDLRVGGRYRFVQQAPDGQRFSFHGTYLEIERPRRLVKTFVYAGRPDNEAVDTFTFAPVDDGTLVQCRTVHVSIEARDAHAASGAEVGLRESLSSLQALIANISKGTSR
jgi:uncharacterized protein YndB with AHSA1/START domain